MLSKVIPQLNKCTGCSACFNVCPRHAITIEEDSGQYYGFAARIDESLCVSCGRCRSVCPVINQSENRNREHPDCYAVFADRSVLMESTSGGAFTLIAESILEQGGYVAGAAFDDQFRVHHILINKKEDLSRIRRSKYVQSRLDNIFSRIRELVDEHPVLFVGTPCQVAGLRRFIGDPANLYCADLYCTQTPPERLFQSYLSENFPENNVVSYAFRTKQNGWVCDTVTVETSDDQTLILNQQSDSYQQCYHSRLAMREVCENCQFSDFPRQGDVSIADFWWIEETYPDLKNPLGTSAVIVNNAKGEALLQYISDHAACCQSVDLEAMHKNRPKSVEAHPKRDRFYDLFSRKTFNSAVHMALEDQFDVVVWGNWTEKNYGSELTYYALYQTLTRMGNEVLMVERPKTAVWGPNDHPVLFRQNPYPDHACVIPNTKEEMTALNHRSDTFLVGSDQIWHPDLYDCFGKVCYLDFIFSSNKKIAYASSFGREVWKGTPLDRRTTSLLLSDFDSVSVREPSGVEICKREFQADAVWVLDPVFLCPADNYAALAQSSELIRDDHHIGVYVLDANADKEALIRQAEEKLNKESSIISDAFVSSEAFWGRSIITDASIEDWIANIYYADFVITDSFHGMCFSLIMHKPFIAITNSKRGSTRFTELLSFLGLEDRLIGPDHTADTIDHLLTREIDYDKVDEILEKKRSFSEAWLKEALQKPKPFIPDRETLLEDKVDQIQETLSALSALLPERKKIEDWHTERLDYHDKIQKWQTERLDYLDKIQKWHTERLDYQDKVLSDVAKRLDNLEAELSKSFIDRMNSAMDGIISKKAVHKPKRKK